MSKPSTQSNQQTKLKTARVTLSPEEGHWLFDFLHGLIETEAQATDLSNLDEILDKVEDAGALAVWLREYVSVEFDGPEAAKLCKVLKDVIEERSIASESGVSLAGIHGKLEKYSNAVSTS